MLRRIAAFCAGGEAFIGATVAVAFVARDHNLTAAAWAALYTTLHAGAALLLLRWKD
ncbi:hypothetical protein HPO96_37210 [Kribbella sandramycini]|uniref:Uncharacterized protein n=1 Tax=Kribbella sandramycini TaxID=60450 RepID=A0A7Y4L7K8_9ACTN|nr:hypothetical protein [Kribbella sandramycini]MBB6564443.1 hypothetical protein [Kribbella sandramycini]NOL45900.1 hypothetical protein [Kribbella sandramycini]